MIIVALTRSTSKNWRIYINGRTESYLLNLCVLLDSKYTLSVIYFYNIVLVV